MEKIVQDTKSALQDHGVMDIIHKIQESKTPEEVAVAIWSQKLVAVSAAAGEKRKQFAEWVRCYAEGITPKQWGEYKNPRQLAESIWKPHLDTREDGGVFALLRTKLEDWIEDYAEGLEEGGE